MDRISVFRKVDSENPNSELEEVGRIELENGDELRVTTGSHRRAGTLIPPVTAIANAIGGKAVVNVEGADKPVSITGQYRDIPAERATPTERVIAVIKPGADKS